MKDQSKKTLLHGWHTENGATMAEFGGYDMPLWYSSAKNEHLAVLTHAGLFDTSHMASVLVSGPDARDLLQYCVTSDMDACIGREKKPLYPGRCVYGAFLNEQGEVVDDTIVFMLEENNYLVVVNAGMGGAIAEQLASYKENRDATITDLTDNLGKLDIQGPKSAVILEKILKSPETVFDRMPYFSFKGHFDASSAKSGEVTLLDGTPILLSRTGYTGEFGFEIFTAPEHFVRVWQMLLKAGESEGLTACGLAARDSLRAGAVLPLSHQDIGHWPFINHPWPFALPYTDNRDGFTKTFVGADALLKAKNAAHTYPFAGNDLRKVTLPASVLDESGAEIGTVLTCATDMAIGRCGDRIFSIVSPDKPEDCKLKGLCCGFVKVNGPLKTGQALTLADSRRKIPVRVESDIRPDRTARRPMKEMR